MLQKQVSQNDQYQQPDNKLPRSSLFELQTLGQGTENDLNNLQLKQGSQSKDSLSSQTVLEKQQQVEEITKQIEQTYDVLPPVNNFLKFCFMMFGILAFAGWNAVITAFDYFSVRYPKEEIPDVTFYFPFGVMIGDIISGVTFVAQAKYFSVKSRFMYTVVIEVIVIISLCIVAMYYNNMSGFWISMFLLFIDGWADNVKTNTFVVIAGSVHPQLNNLFWTYTAFSGLIMNALRFIVLAIFGDDLDSNANYGTLIYFCTCAVIFIITIICFAIFIKSNYYKISLKIDSLKQQKIKLEEELYFIKNQDQQRQNNVELQGFSKIFWGAFNYLKEFIFITKHTGFLSFYLFLSFFETFLLFPGVCVFRKPQFTFLEFAWAAQVMMTAFNLGDFIGKYIGYIKCLHRLYWIYGLVILRISFIPVFILMAKDEGSAVLQDDYFIMCMIFLFSITNGFITTSLAHLSPRKITDPYIRDKVNFFSNFTMTLGIDLGIVLAIFLGNALPTYG
ncbi:nucleoside transporter family protein (macronuclear) [Tetrahymena thermophila SB210]|uniref:Nucleoside transporter family protein n=1 Tax=Tetrahymena thermophila (strain SB210) TaxID=312017 RepID=Q22WJ0_TETTS|nr:nucleoside transporter family protein [Tetrahymena thermophila SB210]EAR89427.1 nucleoside transporter family protein [Tetrahymena thermophila SB210]|eukprot:XP_001009672.1 nucleoside transporter family protein [Tetrahymena thermophila SB210]